MSKFRAKLVSLKNSLNYDWGALRLLQVSAMERRLLGVYNPRSDVALIFWKNSIALFDVDHVHIF